MHVVTLALTATALSTLIRKVADPTNKMTGMLPPPFDMDVLAFGPPVPARFSLFPRNPAKHFAIFIQSLVIVMGYGTGPSLSLIHI